MSQPSPLRIAGATGYGVWPPNSLEGMKLCLEAPVDGVEIDVQLTADGRVIAHHDYRLNPDRTRLNGAWLGEASAPLKLLSLEEIQRFDVGRLRPGSKEAERHAPRQEMDGVAVPTLRALLAAMKAAPGPRRLLYVEIKTDPQDPRSSPEPPEIVAAVLDDLQAEDYLEHAKIIAFDWAALRLARDRCETIRTAHLTIPRALRPRVKFQGDGRSPFADGCDPFDFAGSELMAIKAHGGQEWSPYYDEVTVERIREARELGLLVGPWGLSTGEQVAAMRELGVFSVTVSGPDWGL